MSIVSATKGNHHTSTRTQYITSLAMAGHTFCPFPQLLHECAWYALLNGNGSLKQFDKIKLDYYGINFSERAWLLNYLIKYKIDLYGINLSSIDCILHIQMRCHSGDFGITKFLTYLK